MADIDIQQLRDSSRCAQDDPWNVVEVLHQEDLTTDTDETGPCQLQTAKSGLPSSSIQVILNQGGEKTVHKQVDQHPDGLELA